MSQSSKCDEHRRLHNAKSPSLIDDTVTHTHTHAGMPPSHTHIHARVRSPAKKKKKSKKNAVLAHTSTGRRAPLLSHGSPPGSGSPVLHAHTLRSHTLHSLSLSLARSLCAALSHTHTHTHALMLQHLLSQRGRRGVKKKKKKRGRRGGERKKEKRRLGT